MGANNEQPMLSSGLRTLTGLISRNPRMTLALVIVSVCVSVTHSAMHLEFKTRRADLIDPRADFHQRWLNYTHQFGETSDLIVVVESDNQADIHEVLDELGRRMEKNRELFQNVWYRQNTEAVSRKGLQLLTTEQLQDVHQQLTIYRRVLQGEWDLVRLTSLVPLLSWQMEQNQARSPQQQQYQSKHWEHVQLLGRSLNEFQENPESFIPPWPMAGSIPREAFAQAAHSDYLMNDQGTMGYLKATPVATSESFNGPEQAIDRLRTWINELNEVFPHVEIGLTGIPVLESDEMRRSQFDSMITTGISMAGVLVLLLVGFRGKKHPLLLMSSLAVALAWTFSFATLTIGHLNILTVSFTAILVGLGIDFSIHYLSRYLQYRHEGEAVNTATVETVGNVGLGIVTSALTTALAFLCATLTPFLGVAELGIISGGGIMLCVLATFIMMPAMLALSDRSTAELSVPTPMAWTWLRKISYAYPRLTLFVTMCFIGGLISQIVKHEDGEFSSRVKYDYNLLNLQADGVDSVKALKRLTEQSKHQVLFAVSLADSADEARELATQYAELSTVDHVETLAMRIPVKSQENKSPYIHQIAETLTNLPPAPPNYSPPDPAEFGSAVEQLWKVLRKLRSRGSIATAADYDRFLDRFEEMDLNAQMKFLAEYEARMIGSLWRQLQILRASTDPRPLTLADYPKELRDRFISADGKWLVQIYPKANIWDYEPLHRFVTDVREVDPEVTGTPLQNYEAGRQIRTSYENAAYYALIVIFMVLLWDSMSSVHSWGTLIPPALVIGITVVILKQRGVELHVGVAAGACLGMVALIALIWDWRSVRDACLAMLPPVLGGMMMFGILALLHVDLNAANLIVLPLILGIGVDNGVHLIHEFRHNSEQRFMLSPSTTNAIILSATTTIVGFGSMMFAAHRGLYSLGLVLTVGVSCSLFVSLVPLPAILRLISSHGTAAEADEENDLLKSSDDSPKKRDESDQARKARRAQAA
ncbi:MAG: MMPL family transporter [Planctomycetaceae bacterium]